MCAILFIPVILISGGAVDLVAHERRRVALQNALDRAVLAAASLSQTIDAKKVVEEYVHQYPLVKTAKVTVNEEKSTNFRKIVATASINYDTAFLRIINIPILPAQAAATALESRKNIELSLVLDISGSMLDNGGMVQLKPAAKSFLQTILKDDRKDFTSVNLIPYAGGVNIGDGVFDYLAGPSYKRRHNLSSCFEQLDADFNTTTKETDWPNSDQYPHFTYYNWNIPGKQPWWCPSTANAAVSYVTNDLDYLSKRIDALLPFDGTGTYYGIKWAEFLLNPAFKIHLNNIASKNLANPVPSKFLDRPAKFDSASGTLKYIVLMTDGGIGFQVRPKDPKTNTVTNGDIKSSSREIYSASKGVTFYNQICTKAKAEGITIFTIAFKVDTATATALGKCASSPSYAYKVDGLDMAQAFRSIATTMQALRITQ